jgi:hypothetical protein
MQMLSHDTFADFPPFPPMEESTPREIRACGMNYAELEKKYHVNRRTLYRWKKLGVNLNSPQQVAAHITKQKNSSPAAIEAAIQTLQKS